MLLDLWGPAYARCWPLAEPWVEFRRGDRDDHQGLWRDFQTLGEEATNGSHRATSTSRDSDERNS